ncbi:hypothetical protein STAFG_0705 [Streptomyces afghaniensis 772]|uniref:Uncharacterized protein n=1 Tax=Streptomyces afghaniensis 772 TaxID=1283301 RepID=S4MRU6_9ACTN|nr:hypothetical protein STAFG_0705 [Streptomyces afghaniensis 772]
MADGTMRAWSVVRPPTAATGSTRRCRRRSPGARRGRHRARQTRGAAARRLALEQGAASAQDAYARPPEPLDSAILFAPVGELVPLALRAPDRGGVLAVAGIHLTDTPPPRIRIRCPGPWRRSRISRPGGSTGRRCR